MFKLIIAGGRNFSDSIKLENSVFEYIKENNLQMDSIEIVSGKANGADKLGEQFSKKHNLALKLFPANWKDLNEPCVIKQNQYGQYNALAGNNRNLKMAEYSDGLLVFWDKKSKGTKNMIDLAKKKKLIVAIVNY